MYLGIDVTSLGLVVVVITMEASLSLSDLQMPPSVNILSTTSQWYTSLYPLVCCRAARIDQSQPSVARPSLVKSCLDTTACHGVQTCSVIILIIIIRKNLATVKKHSALFACFLGGFRGSFLSF